ncbi:SDR family NAD(P)-dependent oxidoreductase [Mycobacterium sp. WMMD1722]|uniref:SDR family NAD(P)-dependent oxidoreductase n=1 Tax=Mycobacterium sp. WMMD1722 TaxID=3404117 RepID=UPI003BF4649D
MPTRVALITGSGRPLGIGFAVAQQLAERGYHVILSARDRARADGLAEELRTRGLSADALALDLTERQSVVDAAQHIEQTFGHLDVLVNNATHGPDHTVLAALDADPEEVRAAFDVDVVGSWRLTAAMVPLLRRAPAARIVNVSSVSAQQIASGLDLGAPLRAPAYSMAKYNLTVLTGILSRELADGPILVNAVDPGDTATHPERGDDHSRPAAESARDIVWAATLGPDGPNGMLFRDGQPVVELS